MGTQGGRGHPALYLCTLQVAHSRHKLHVVSTWQILLPACRAALHLWAWRDNCSKDQQDKYDRGLWTRMTKYVPSQRCFKQPSSLRTASRPSPHPYSNKHTHGPLSKLTIPNNHNAFLQVVGKKHSRCERYSSKIKPNAGR